MSIASWSNRINIIFFAKILFILYIVTKYCPNEQDGRAIFAWSLLEKKGGFASVRVA